MLGDTIKDGVNSGAFTESLNFDAVVFAVTLVTFVTLVACDSASETASETSGLEEPGDFLDPLFFFLLLLLDSFVGDVRLGSILATTGGVGCTADCISICSFFCKTAGIWKVVLNFLKSAITPLRPSIKISLCRLIRWALRFLANGMNDLLNSTLKNRYLVCLPFQFLVMELDYHLNLFRQNGAGVIVIGQSLAF
jgi:hypothetical protein